MGQSWHLDDPRHAMLAERNRLGTGKKHTEIAKQHMSAAQRKIRSREVEKRHCSEETRKRMSLAFKESWAKAPSERREQLIARTRRTWTGRKHTPEAREKIRQAKIGSKGGGRPTEKWTPDQREQARVKATGYRHTSESKAKMSAARRGKSLSEKNRQGIISGWLKHLESPPSNCTCAVHRNLFPLKMTKLEKILLRLLSEFPEVDYGRVFGRYRVDAYLPEPYHLAFEADGRFWHQDKERDAKRDDWLFRRFGLPVIRLSELELKEIGKCLVL